MTEYVKNIKCEDLIKSLEDESVDLFLTDPPYHNIVQDRWDRQWSSLEEYVKWFTNITKLCVPKLKKNGSFIFFGATGSHKSHPIWDLIREIENETNLFYRDIITWKKRRAYGKTHGYLYCREEICWMSKSSERTEVTFNIPYTEVLRGYDGFNKKYKALNPYKRVSNVFDDIHELMRPKRTAEKPIKLMERLVLTHSNEGNLIVDPFAGTGATGIAAIKNNRNFIGCDMDSNVCKLANERCITLK